MKKPISRRTFFKAAGIGTLFATIGKKAHASRPDEKKKNRIRAIQEFEMRRKKKETRDVLQQKILRLVDERFNRERKIEERGGEPKIYDKVDKLRLIWPIEQRNYVEQYKRDLEKATYETVENRVVELEVSMIVVKYFIDYYRKAKPETEEKRQAFKHQLESLQEVEPYYTELLKFTWEKLYEKLPFGKERNLREEK